MNQEMIEALLNWLMWIGLDASIGVFAVAAIVATGEAQKRLLRDGGTG